jgi:hypothetical protein
MSVRGDTRRPTKLLSFDDALSMLSVGQRADAERSVWRTSLKAGRIYCSMKFCYGQQRGWRYDSAVMIPMNGHARRLSELFPRVLTQSRFGISIQWKTTNCLVIDNWRVLHGRGAAPPDEGRRELLRLYVK